MEAGQLSAFPSRTDILVASAGPTGLALAVSLRQHGHYCTIIDAGAEGQETSRAAVIHARTLEVLDEVDVTSRLLSRGHIVDTFRVRDRDRVLLTIDFGGLPSRYPYALMLAQNETEATLHERLGELGVEVVRPAAWSPSEKAVRA